MAYEEAKVTMYSCDSPPCNKTEAVENGAAPKSFILGTVEIPASLGGGTAEWAAHAPVHFGKAVKGVLAQAGATDEGAEVASES